MLGHGAPPRRDSCDILPKGDDAAKKCVQSTKPEGTGEVPSFKTESYGLPITFASPRSHEAYLDYLVAIIQAKDAGKSRILLVCQQNSEALRVKSELGMRNINIMLLDADHRMTRHMVRLWSQGYINQVLICCDTHIKLFEGIHLDLVINTTLPPVSKFKERVENLKKLGKKADIVAFTSSGSQQESLSVKPQPEKKKKKRGKRIPKLVVKPLTMNPEDTPCSSNSLSSTQIGENEPKKKGKEVVNSPLKRFNEAIKELFEKPPVLDEYPSSSSLEMAEQAEAVVGSLREEQYLPKTPESDGWATPPESLPFSCENSDSIQRKLEAILRARNPPSFRHSFVPTNGQYCRGAPEDKGITLVMYGVLAWSRELLMSCYDIKGIPNLNPLIRDAMIALDIGNSRARGLQRFAWPHVSNGMSLVAVGPETVGKTWCFLPSLCQRTHEQLLLRTQYHYGPTSIVVCGNQQQGNQILQWIIKLLAPLPELPIPCEQVVTLWEKGNVQAVASQLNRTVGILVTTPDMLLLLKDSKEPLFDTKSVKCLALDNLSHMMRYMPVATAKMIFWITHWLDFHPDRCQLFVTTRLWPDTLMRTQLLPLVRDVLVIFKDAFEAIIYGGGGLELMPIQAGKEVQSLVQLLRGRSLDEERIVVVCQASAEVLQLRQKLAEADLGAVTIYSDTELSAVANWRQRPSARVLVVSDNLIEKVKCGPVDLVIHYSPGTSWMRFKFRSCLFFNNYASWATDPNPGKSIVLLPQSDTDRIWLLAEFMMWHHLPRPRYWLSILSESRKAEYKTDSELAKLTLCDQITSYGDCLRRTCRYRHVLWKEEVQPPSNYPTEGQIRFHVLSCNSPVHMAVRLNDLYPTKVSFLNTPMTKLGEEVQLHYENEDNRRKHENPKTGDIVIIKNMKRYERAVITVVENNNGRVHMCLLDNGIDVLTSNRSQIFECHQRFQTEPNQAMELRLLGLEPETMDRIWTKDARDEVRAAYFPRLNGARNRIYTAQVEFVLFRTIFVKTVVDDKERDLRTLVSNRLDVHEEEETLDKLKLIAKESKAGPKS